MDLRPEPWRDPQWDEDDLVHNWRNYILEGLRAIWDTFTDEQKRALYENANTIAGEEDWD